MTNDFTHLDLFSGIGGFAIAAQRAGFRTVGFSEVKPHAIRKYQQRFPNTLALGDVTKRGSFTRLRGRVTAVSAGFPCQPWSLAGKRKGSDDARHLGPAMLDVLAEVRAPWFIGENVPEFIRMGGFDAMAAALENLGYSVQPFVIPACAVGNWQLRERLCLVAHREGWGCESQGQLRPEPEAERATSGDQAADDSVSGLRRPRRGELHAPTFTEEQTQGSPWHDSIDATPLRFPRWDADLTEVLRMADGLSLGLDSSERNGRIEALGNAIVPQAFEPFFHWIAQIERGELT